jgi:thiol-disulfide isomerase/thioredoxin
MAVCITGLLAGLVALAGCGDDGGRDSTAPGGSSAGPTPAVTASGSNQSGPPSAGQLSFTGTTLDGRPFNAATLAGKPVVLWFWAPWCPICKGQAPDVLDLHQQYAGRVGLVGVAGLDDKQNMQPFVDMTRTGDLIHLADPDGKIWQQFGVTQQSTFVLIDASGNVTFSGKAGGDEIRSKVAALAG